MSVQASHILVKHEGSRNPTSWKDPKGEKIRVRTREQAHTTLQGFVNDITSGKKTFSEIATTESDCGSAKAGGDLGVFGRGEMQEVISFSLILTFLFNRNLRIVPLVLMLAK
jgi:NIMA-interacting peptidyl-prolyl cis-trans isomerase 1